jgi:hypothetical protein
VTGKATGKAATTKLSDYKVADKPTMDLLNVWFSIMSRVPPREFVEATNEEKGAFYRDLCMEMDRRLPTAERITALEARVDELENHPAGCSCTRCTG